MGVWRPRLVGGSQVPLGEKHLCEKGMVLGL